MSTLSPVKLSTSKWKFVFKLLEHLLSLDISIMWRIFKWYRDLKPNLFINPSYFIRNKLNNTWIYLFLYSVMVSNKSYFNLIFLKVLNQLWVKIAPSEYSNLFKMLRTFLKNNLMYFDHDFKGNCTCIWKTIWEIIVALTSK